MVVSGFGPYHRLVHADAPTERTGVIPTPWTMPLTLGFGAILLGGEYVIGHGILAGKYLAEYRDSLKQLFADVSGDRQSLGSFATSSQMRTDGRSYTW